MTARLTPHRVRSLTAGDLGYTSPATVTSTTPPPASPWATLDPIEDDDPILLRVLDLLETFGGVIFTGPPGTSKSWYAARIAVYLTGGGDRERMRVLQFHPSYQYEDFVEGFVPLDGGGFKLEPKHLLQLAKKARDKHDDTHVILIDELSRGEPGRIFGEALTYVEKSKRGFDFQVASGTEVILPDNLVFLATMNPQDRGVDEVDAAFERRFAKIALDPNEDILVSFLTDSGMEEELRKRVVRFFQLITERAKLNPLAALGHTFFIGVKDEDGLQRLWDHQLRFVFEKAFRLDPEGLAEIHRAWDAIVLPPVPAAAAATESET